MNTLIVNNYIIDTPIYDILLQLRSELTNNKLKIIKKPKGSHIQVTCPHHSEGMEKNPSCGIYIGDTDTDYGNFNCFTCGEHGSFVHFVAQCFDSSESFAENWLITRFGKSKALETPKFDLEPIDLSVKNRNMNNDTISSSILESFQSWHPYMDKRKLTKKVCETFQIKYDPKTESIVFPVWDEYGKLYMLTRRSVKNKMFYIDKKKEKPIYLLNFIREKGIQEVTVCESQINTLTLWGWGIPSVATFGCNITPKQMEIFNRSSLKHIYLCFDGDEAGKKGTKKFLENIRKDIFVDVIQMPASKDVNDLTEEEFNSLPIKDGQVWLKENL